MPGVSAKDSPPRTFRARLCAMQHMPIGAVSKNLGVTPAVLKRMMRANRVAAWPFRQLHALGRHAGILRAHIERADRDDERTGEMEIWLDQIESERERIMAGNLSLQASEIALTSEMKKLLSRIKAEIAK